MADFAGFLEGLGGVHSQIRTGLHPYFPDNGRFTGNFSGNTGFCTKALVSCAVISKACGANSLEKLAGNFFEPAGKQQGIILRKQGICSGVISSREESSIQLRKTLELFCLSSEAYAILTINRIGIN